MTESSADIEQVIRQLQDQLSEVCAQRDSAEVDRDDLNKRLEELK